MKRSKTSPDPDTVRAVESVIPPAPVDKRTPDEWAAQLGRMLTGAKVGNMPRPTFPCWEHSAAAALHGWAVHAHHAGAPIQLTQADYEAALSAVESAPYTPHPGALSPHHRRG